VHEKVQETPSLRDLCGGASVDNVTWASREDAKTSAFENRILRRGSMPAFSHSQDPERTRSRRATLCAYPITPRMAADLVVICQWAWLELSIPLSGEDEEVMSRRGSLPRKGVWTAWNGHAARHAGSSPAVAL
jgi:hypothetical protein